MTRLMTSEWYKIRRSKLLALILVGIAAQTVFQVWTSYTDHFVNLGQTGLLKMAENSILLCMWIAGFIGLYTAPEFQQGTLRNVLALGKNRSHVYLSMLLSSSIAIAAILAVVSIVATVGLTAAFGFGDMALGDFLRFFFWNYLMQLLYHLSFAALFCMFAFICKSPGITILLGIGYTVASFALTGFLDKHLPVALDYLPQTYISGFTYFSSDPAFVVRGLFVSAAYFVITWIVGSIVFKKSDIK